MMIEFNTIELLDSFKIIPISIATTYIMLKWKEKKEKKIKNKKLLHCAIDEYIQYIQLNISEKKEDDLKLKKNTNMFDLSNNITTLVLTKPYHHLIETYYETQYYPATSKLNNRLLKLAKNPNANQKSEEIKEYKLMLQHLENFKNKIE